MSSVENKIAQDFLKDEKNVDLKDPACWSEAGLYMLAIGRVMETVDTDGSHPPSMSVSEFIGGVAYSLCLKGGIEADDLSLVPEVCYQMGVEQARLDMQNAMLSDPGYSSGDFYW